MARFVLFSLLTLGGFVSYAQPAASTIVVPGQPGRVTNISSLSRGPDPSQRYQRVVAVYPGADVVGISGGVNLLSVGFRLRTPAPAAASGTLRVWLRNTTDVNYALANDWAYLLQNPTVFQAVYNGPLTIPAAAGWFDVSFQTPFAYTGSGFYLAYEWETATPVATSGAYECDDYLPQALRAGTSQTAFPALVAQVSTYRPQLRIGYATPGRDAAVVAVFGPGKMPMQTALAPYPVQAIVRNAGSVALTNLPVTFTPGPGAGASPVTTLIAALAPGAQVSVRLPGLAPTGPAGQYVRYQVSVPADQNPANDARNDSTLATAQELTYVRGYPNAAFGVAGVGFNAARGSGTLLCRYPLRLPALVSSIRVRLWNSANNPGNTVFAVLLDEQGALVARSADYVLPAASANISQWQTFALPQPTRVTGRAFFVGLAQTAPATAGRYYFPLARQAEAPMRDSAYYSTVGDSALTGLKRPREFRTLGRFMVEADMVTAPLAVRNAGTPSVEASVWPNPVPVGTRTVYLGWVGEGASNTTPATVEVLDLVGRVVQPETRLRLAQSATAPVQVLLNPGLASGVYVLHIRLATDQVVSRRIQIE